MPDLAVARAEIERMRVQVGRQRKEILQLKGQGSIPCRPKPCWRGCWPRSTFCAPNATDSRGQSPASRAGLGKPKMPSRPRRRFGRTLMAHR
jgi:hypothetical protein